MDYILTLQDIDDYLDSKKDDEPVGITCNAMKCMVAEAFKMKYPDCNVLVDSAGIDVWPPLAIRWLSVTVEPGVPAIIRRFDTIYFQHEEYEYSVTKREWLEVAQ